MRRDEQDAVRAVERADVEARVLSCLDDVAETLEGESVQLICELLRRRLTAEVFSDDRDDPDDDR